MGRIVLTLFTCVLAVTFVALDYHLESKLHLGHSYAFGTYLHERATLVDTILHRDTSAPATTGTDTVAVAAAAPTPPLPQAMARPAGTQGFAPVKSLFAKPCVPKAGSKFCGVASDTVPEATGAATTPTPTPTPTAP